MDGSPPLAARRAALETAVGALRGLEESLWEASGSELSALLGLVDAVASMADAGRVAVTEEAAARGEISGSQSASAAGWVAEHAPSLRCTGASRVARTVEACVRPDLTILRRAVLDGEVTVPVALTVVAEYDRLRSRLTDEAKPTVLSALIEVGAQHGAPAVRLLRPALLARHGLQDDFQQEQDRASGLVALSHALADDGVWDYRLRLDAPGKAALEAAVGPLSSPWTVDGSRDPRSAQQRRGQALVEVCRRASAATASAEPGDGPTVGAKAAVYVTIPLSDLERRTGSAIVLGSLDTGLPLAPETARRIACDAKVIPAVLGGQGELLDLGRSRRLFSPGQIRALWLRDRRCTFPGCTIPAHWSDAHHVVHWVDGGRTDVSNAALLCGRHHTVVHRDRLTADVLPTGVTWDVRAGSYDVALEALETRRAVTRELLPAP